MKYLCVLLVVGLTSIVNAQTAEQPYCKDILGFHNTKGPFSGVLPKDYSGEVFYCREDGKVEQWYNYKDGKMDGLRRTWHWDGQLRNEIPYKDGERDGLSTSWHASGKLFDKQNFVNDKRVGKYRKWWESNGKLQIEYKYSESGDGTLDGWYYEYYEDADVKIMGKYKGGYSPSVSKKLGIWRYYYDTDFNKGQKSKKEVYTETGDGVLISKECWDVDGNVIRCP